MEGSEAVFVGWEFTGNAALPYDDLFRVEFDVRRSARRAFEFLHVDDCERSFGRVAFSFKAPEE